MTPKEFSLAQISLIKIGKAVESLPVNEYIKALEATRETVAKLPEAQRERAVRHIDDMVMLARAFAGVKSTMSFLQIQMGKEPSLSYLVGNGDS